MVVVVWYFGCRELSDKSDRTTIFRTQICRSPQKLSFCFLSVVSTPTGPPTKRPRKNLRYVGISIKSNEQKAKTAKTKLSKDKKYFGFSTICSCQLLSCLNFCRSKNQGVSKLDTNNNQNTKLPNPFCFVGTLYSVLQP